MRNRKVAVIGANGHTGRFVVQALRDKGLTPIGIARKPAAQPPVEMRLAEIGDAAALDRALQGTLAVVNCAGPFLDTARPVVAAALRAKIPYLDLAAEQAAVLDIIETYDHPAKAAGIVVLPAMAFFGGLADLLASVAMQDWPRADDIDIAVALDYWHPTHGTRRTGERNTVPRVVIRDGTLVPVPVPSPPPAGEWNFPRPFGSLPVTCVALSEVIAISRHIRVANLTSFMNLKALADVRDDKTPPPKPASANGASDQNFVVEVRVRAGGQQRSARASGKDIYAVSAPLIAEACAQVLAMPGRHAGVRAPGELFEPRGFLAALAPHIIVETTP